ncbi:helix-turn-helix domain-containing protein [Kitasatospora herbaricolor]|uniref:TetR/AcrR family transcriptional regulator n=1 Tax=Kitasatospora herbaricolor TaxID=68217 RepID=A0ABZ1W6Q0_9ACTN|nr:helix-turn-helix domain-containing protein [Kitasatospora herbaricolor]
MTDTDPAAATTPRRRDAEGSRRALLDAARALFGERGYERTTVREIGEQAGVDPALIARYFGSKAALYVAALHSDQDHEAPAADLLAPGRLDEVLAKVDRVGPSPVLQAAVRPHDDQVVQRAARAALSARLTGPLEQRLERSGADRARLRAELAVAAVAGIALARSAGAFDALGAAPHAEVAELTTRMLEALAE